MNRWNEAGINLIYCHEIEHLNLARRGGTMGWVPVPMAAQEYDLLR